MGLVRDVDMRWQLIQARVDRCDLEFLEGVNQSVAQGWPRGHPAQTLLDLHTQNIHLPQVTLYAISDTRNCSTFRYIS